jgi:hypothetical protein
MSSIYVDPTPREYYQDNVWVLDFISLVNYKFAKDENFVNHFTYLLVKFFEDNQSFLKHFKNLILKFRKGEKPHMILNFLGERYVLSIVDFVAEYNMAATAQCCYSEAEILVANKTSVTYDKERSYEGMEVSLFHEIMHILVYKTGHEEKNREKFISGMAPLVHGFYKENEGEW